MINNIKVLLTRDLNKLKSEMEMYNDEYKIWQIERGIKNSAGNLCLHLVGNLNYYIGAQLGMTNYIRNRDLEFSLKDIPRKELISGIEETIVMIDVCLSKIKDEDLENDYPIVVYENKMSTGYFLAHLTAHLGYHLGQVNYHRRLLDE